MVLQLLIDSLYLLKYNGLVSREIWPDGKLSTLFVPLEGNSIIGHKLLLVLDALGIEWSPACHVCASSIRDKSKTFFIFEHDTSVVDIFASVGPVSKVCIIEWILK